jgi:CMP-N,N'-diacetyllegionaminic acid synthase
MRVLGLIPARGGSKGVPRKNVRQLAGKPMLHYTAEAALSAVAIGALARVILSTEDAEIADIGRACGLDVPFMRPPELALDETPMLPVVQHAIRFAQNGGHSYDAVCLLQPTTPLRSACDIERAVKLLNDTDADSVISFVRVGDKHPARMKLVDGDGRVTNPPFAELMEGQRRQDLPPLYLREGSIYLTRVSVLLEQGSMSGRDCRALIMPEERAVNVDSMMDLVLAEQLLLRGREALSNQFRE